LAFSTLAAAHVETTPTHGDYEDDYQEEEQWGDCQSEASEDQDE